MQISARIALVGSIVFALLCLGFAFNGFTSLGDITDPKQLEDAKGFAMFWAFLGVVAVASGLVSLWIMKLPAEGE